MKLKNGINLVTLTVTVFISFILLTVIITTTNDIRKKALATSFTNEIKILEDEVEAKYIQTKTLPTTGSILTLNQFIALNSDSSKQTDLRNEITLNGDTVNNFYEIDLSKLNIKNTKYGNKKNSLDKYFLSTNTFNVYYIKGLKIGNNTYFSITSKIEEINNEK